MTAEDRARIDAAIDDALTPPDPPDRPATGDTGAVSLRLLGVGDLLDMIAAVAADLDGAHHVGYMTVERVGDVVRSLDRLGFVITKRFGS